MTKPRFRFERSTMVMAAALAALALVAAPVGARGGGRGGGGGARGGGGRGAAANTSVHGAERAPNRDFNQGGRDQNRDANANRNVNVNQNRNENINVNRNVDVDVHGHGGYGYDRWGHPVAGAVAVTAAATLTAMAIGTMVATLPSSGCSGVAVAGVAYQHCGANYYQPVYSGSNVQYVVVSPPQ